MMTGGRGRNGRVKMKGGGEVFAAPLTEEMVKQRRIGYLDALRGLAEDGQPDPEFVKWMADSVNERVPKLTFKVLKDQST